MDARWNGDASGRASIQVSVFSCVAWASLWKVVDLSREVSAATNFL